MNLQRQELIESLKQFAVSRNGWLLLAFSAVLFIAPMALIGVYNGGDIPHHAQLAGTFEKGIRSGDFYPDWGADENAGYGGVAVRLYQPAVPFLWAAFRVISGSWHTAAWMLFFVFAVVGGFGVYQLAKEFTSRQFAILAGILFIFMPYHAFSVYGSSMYAEFAGCSLIAFSLLFVTRICRGGTLFDVLGLAASFGPLVITHLPSALTGSLVLFVYSLALIDRKNFWRSGVLLTVGAGLGLAASSFYWVKVVTERGFKNTASWQDSHFDYRLNFLLTSPWFDNRNLWLFDLIWLMLLVLGAGSIYIILRRNEPHFGKQIYGIIAVFSLSMFMSTGFSKPVWSVLPLIGEIQFPWRWLTLATVAACVLCAVAVSRIGFANNSNSLKFVGGLFLLLFGSVSCLMLMDYRLSYVPASKFDQFITAEANAIGGPWFWPIRATEKAFDVKEKVRAGDRAVTFSKWDGSERRFTISPGDEKRVRVATFYYPYWTANINGAAVDVAAEDDGAINIAIPNGAVDVELAFVEPAFVKVAKWISLFAWLALAGCLAAGFIKRSGTRFQTLTVAGSGSN